MKAITMNVTVDSEDTYVEVMKSILENVNNQIKVLEGKPKPPQMEFQHILAIRGGKNGCTFGSNLFNIWWISAHLSISKKNTHIIFAQLEDGVDVYITYYKQNRVNPKVWKVIKIMEDKFKKDNEDPPIDTDEWLRVGDSLSVKMLEGVGDSLVYYASRFSYCHNQMLLRKNQKKSQ